MILIILLLVAMIYVWLCVKRFVLIKDNYITVPCSIIPLLVCLIIGACLKSVVQYCKLMLFIVKCFYSK